MQPALGSVPGEWLRFSVPQSAWVSGETKEQGSGVGLVNRLHSGGSWWQLAS